jgi:hypothetical protein
MKSVGQGMKSATSGIAQTATAFATLALSVVSTWRAYRDLGDAQLGVDKANFKVQKSTQAVASAQKLVAGLKAGMKRTDLESVAATSKIIAREEALKKKLKDGSITRKAAKAEQDAINLARSKVGSDKATELAKAEQDLKNKTEALGFATESAAQKQKHFNDSTQDFYLSLLPTAISVIATAVSGLESVKNIAGGGGGGLIGSLSGIGLVLGAGSVALLAYKNNWLGFRDVVGGVIKWLQERFGAWKDTIQQVFALIQKHDWGGAFNKIREAAAKFWEDLKKTVPFFGEVEKLVEKIRNGNWKGAFLQIWKAASDVWETIKKNIPFFAGAEVFFKQLFSGNLSGAFSTLAAGVKTGLESVFGKDAVGGLQEKIGTMINSAKNLFAQFAFDLNKPGGSIDLIQKGFAKLGQGDIIGGFGNIGKGIKLAIDGASIALNNWVLQNFGINLAGLEGAATVIGNKILDGIKTGLTFVARTWIDPIMASLFDPAVWTAAGAAILGTIKAIGGTIFNFLAGAIQGAAKDPKATASWWGNIGKAIWDGITAWMTTNLPETTKAIQSLVAAFTDSINRAGVDFQNMGISAWNNFVDGWKAGIVKASEANVFSLFMGNQIKDAVNSPEWKNAGKLAMIPVHADTKPFVAESHKATTTVSKEKPTMKILADSKRALEIAKQTTQSINNMHATIKVGTRVVASAGLSGGVHLHQHGYQGTVKRPTMFIAGEGGRPEDVTVRPRGSAQRGGSGGGGGFYGTVNVYVDGVLRTARYSMGARK